MTVENAEAKRQQEPDEDTAYMKLVWRADPTVRECIVKLRQAGLKDFHIARVFRDASKVLETVGE